MIQFFQLYFYLQGVSNKNDLEPGCQINNLLKVIDSIFFNQISNLRCNSVFSGSQGLTNAILSI